MDVVENGRQATPQRQQTITRGTEPHTHAALRPGAIHKKGAETRNITTVS